MGWEVGVNPRHVLRVVTKWGGVISLRFLRVVTKWGGVISLRFLRVVRFLWGPTDRPMGPISPDLDYPQPPDPLPLRGWGH